jgi:hypothetical protein
MSAIKTGKPAVTKENSKETAGKSCGFFHGLPLRERLFRHRLLHSTNNDKY